MTSRAYTVAAAVAATITLMGARPHGAVQGPAERFTALAINMNADHPGSVSRTLEIVVDRWSTDAERDRVFNTLAEQSAGKLLSVIEDLPRVGSISTPATVGYDIRFAQRTDMGPAEQIMLLTDRPISFAQLADQSRSVDYPFSLIQIHISSNGKGSGTLTQEAKLSMDEKTRRIVVENLAIQPISLTSVQRENK